jgi:sulfur-carrier protein
MKVSVRLFARAREAAGGDQVSLELPATARVGDLRVALAAAFPRLAPIAPSLLVAVGNEYAGDQAPLSGQTEIACFPPVSGG